MATLKLSVIAFPPYPTADNAHGDALVLRQPLGTACRAAPEIHTATVASTVNPAAPGAGTVTTALPAGPGVHGVRWPLTSTCCTCPGAYRCTVTCCRGGWNPPTGVPATSVTRVVPSPAAACSSVKVVSAYSPCWYP